MEDANRKAFRRGGMDSFIMSHKRLFFHEIYSISSDYFYLNDILDHLVI
jgi:hypothetical protein